MPQWRLDAVKKYIKLKAKAKDIKLPAIKKIKFLITMCTLYEMQEAKKL